MFGRVLNTPLLPIYYAIIPSSLQLNYRISALLLFSVTLQYKRNKNLSNSPSHALTSTPKPINTLITVLVRMQRLPDSEP